VKIRGIPKKVLSIFWSSSSAQIDNPLLGIFAATLLQTLILHYAFLRK
jgi:hypothetical protein